MNSSDLFDQVSIEDRIRIQESYLQGLYQTRATINKSIIEANAVLDSLLREQQRRDLEAQMMEMEREQAK